MRENAAVNTFVALLRGINVGGKNRIPMTELKSSFAALGYEDVVTYIQSGNVVFRSSSSAERKTAAAIERRIAEEFGTEVTVVLRTPTELKSVAERNPFLKGKADPSKLHVVFLTSRPKAKAVAELDPGRSPPDEFKVHGREIYLHLPKGSGRSKLTIDYFERRLGVAATARNWNTVLKLLALAERSE
jgi:uncharacterized protein (DUF1697 family)